MTLDELFKDKAIKAKEKTEMISQWLLDASLPIDELLAFAEKSKDPVQATCIEAMEYATRQDHRIADENVLTFVTRTLTAKAPRVKWESAKVIGNIAQNFPAKLEKTIPLLLANTRDEGTVVRWSAAFALGEILKLTAKYHAKLLPAIKKICDEEEKNSIIKIYQAALKKAAR